MPSENTSDPRTRDWLLLYLVTVIALVVRLAYYDSTFDVPGDGPTRAAEAYQWSRGPWLPQAGVWPPGYLFVFGVAHWFLPDPAVASRVLNLILGTLTVPTLYLLSRRALGDAPALLGAAAVAVWPLHIELSVSSLSEAAFVFELSAGLLLLERGVGGNRRSSFLAGLGLLILASMTRYEAWWFLPLAAGYVSWRTRDLTRSVLTSLALAAFPIAWLVGNYTQLGDPLAGFTAAVEGATLEGAHAIGLTGAAERLVGIVRQEIGSLAVWLLAGSCLATPLLLLRRRNSVLLYLAVFATFWSAMLYVTSFRDHTLYGRYLVFGIMLSFPLLAACFSAATWKIRHVVAAGFLFALIASFHSTDRYSSHRWITESQPTAMGDLASWLASSAYRNDFILLTDMKWNASYLGLAWPESIGRHAIVSEWMRDRDVAQVVTLGRPSLLVTSKEDREQRSRVESVLSFPLSAAPVVYRADGIEVIDIETDSRP